MKSKESDVEENNTSIRAVAAWGIKWTSLVAIVGAVLGIAQLAILSRYLSAEEMGVLSIVMVAFGLTTTFSDVGISNSLIHFQQLRPQQLNALYWINIACALLASLVLSLSAPLLAQLYNWPTLAPLLYIISFSIVIQSIGQQFQFLLRRDLDFVTVSKILLLQSLISFLTLISLLLFFELDLLAVVGGILAGTIAYSISFYWIGIRRYYRPRLSQLRFDDLRPSLRFGFFQMGDALLNYFTANLDKLIIGKAFGLQVLGAYELAYRLMIRPLLLINPIFNRVSFPILAKLQHQLPAINHWYLTKLSAISFLSFPAYFGLLATSDELIPWLFGEGWTLTLTSFQIIWILGLFKTMGNPIGAYLLALGKPEYGFGLNVYQLFLNLLVLYLGSRWLDYTSLLYVFVWVSIIAVVPVDCFLRFYLTKMSVLAYGRIVGYGLLLSGAMAGSVWLAKQWWELEGWLSLGVSVGIGVFSYGLLLRVFSWGRFREIFWPEKGGD